MRHAFFLKKKKNSFAMPLKCPFCNHPYEPVGGAPCRLPVVFPCHCRACKDCALKKEAEAQGERKKGASDGTPEPTPCLTCSTLCSTPVEDLPLDEALVLGMYQPFKRSVPKCSFCEMSPSTMYVV